MNCQDNLILKRFLWRLFHIEEQINVNAHDITQKNKTLAGLRKDQAVHDKALDLARTKQAKARSDVLAAEKKVKKVEKSLEIRVRYKLTRLSILHSDLRYMIETRLGRGREQNITCSTKAPKS